MHDTTTSDMFEEAAERFKALADKTRLRILAILSYGERCVCELVAILAMSQPSISQHLRKLRLAGFIKERKTAQWVYYALADDQTPLIQAILSELPDGKEEVERSGAFCTDRCLEGEATCS